MLLVAVAAVAVAASAALPPDLPAAARSRLEAITETASVSTRLEGEPFPGRPEVFQFLLDHPALAARVTRVLKLARYRIWREADGFHLDDGWGTVGRFDVVYAAGGTRVMYARGVYQKRFLPDIRGEAVVMIEYGARPGPDGKPHIATTVSGFVKLDSGFLSAATRFATPIARAKADREARTLVKVFAKVTRAVEEQPAVLLDELAREPDVPASDVVALRKLLRLN